MSERLGSWGSDGRSLDQAIRSAAFLFLAERLVCTGYYRGPAGAGFHGDERVPLLGPQGIFKPRLLGMPLSITTVPVVEGRNRPYADELSPDNLLTYRYRGTDPSHRDNVGLRLAMQRQAPLAYFYGVVPGQYLAVWPVYVVRDDPGALSFTVAVDSHERDRPSRGRASGCEERQYVTQLTRAVSIKRASVASAAGTASACRLPLRHTEL
jgi:putative restriction endonuclease